jgi:hypothetical protein
MTFLCVSQQGEFKNTKNKIVIGKKYISKKNTKEFPGIFFFGFFFVFGRFSA